MDLTLSYYILSCSTESYRVPLYPIMFQLYPTISYRVPLYPISWIILSLRTFSSHGLGFEPCVSGSEPGCLHHYTISTGFERYIFWGALKRIFLPKKKKNTTNWNTCIKETRKILKVIYTSKILFLPSLNQLINLQKKKIYVLYFLQLTCCKPHSCSP